jgi:hypothetical protein
MRERDILYQFVHLRIRELLNQTSPQHADDLSTEVEQGHPTLAHGDPHLLSKAGFCILRSFSYRHVKRVEIRHTGYLTCYVEN